MYTNQNETVQNDNTNIAERSSGIRTISLGTTKDMNSKSTRNDSYSHTNNALLMNDQQRFQNLLTIDIQISISPRTVSLGTTKLSFYLSTTTTMHSNLIKIK